MSHYTVLVTGEDVDFQLDPFSEHLEFEEYTTGVVSDEEKERFLEYYYEKGFITEEESFESAYAKYGDDWNGRCWRYNKEEDEWYEWSTYNPDSKWDWYQVGGRWSGSLILKDGKEGEMGERSWANQDKVIPSNKVDSAIVDDVDWDAMIDPDTYEYHSRFWEIYIDGEEPQNEQEERMANHYIKREFFLERYKDKQTYAKVSSLFCTHAVLHNGQWYEKGEMGWFGMSSESHEDAIKWEENYFNHFIKPLLGTKTRITVVDCHI